VNSSDSSSVPTFDLLEWLGRELPEVFEQAQVVGKWVWLEFNVAPVKPTATYGCRSDASRALRQAAQGHCTQRGLPWQFVSRGRH